MELLFSTSQRIKILKTVIFRTDSISVNNIASQLRLSKGLVSKYFQILLKQKILKREKGKLFVSGTPLVSAIRILLNVKSIDTGIFRKYPFITAAGLYGSCARGENNEESDVDLWIRIKDVDEAKVASLTAEISRRVRNSKVMFLSDKKIEKIRKEDTMFYHSLVFGSITLYGDVNAAQI